MKEVERFSRESTVKVLEAEEGTRSGHSGISVARNVFTMHPHLNNSFTHFWVEYEINCERGFSLEHMQYQENENCIL